MNNNRVVHFEITADNPERARRFYEHVFGWKIEKWDGPQPYWMVMTGREGSPGIDGGLLQREDPQDRVVNTIEVESVEAWCARVTEKGGTVTMSKREIPGVGWIAYAQDTEGNDFGLIEFNPEARAQMHDRVTSRNTITWFELPVTDLSRAAKFYETVLGQKLEIQDSGEGPRMALFPTEKAGVHGALVHSSEHHPSENGALVYLYAGSDLSPALKRAVAAGGKVIRPKFGIGRYGFAAIITDTEGNRVALHSPQ